MSILSRSCITSALTHSTAHSKHIPPPLRLYFSTTSSTSFARSLLPHRAVLTASTTTTTTTTATATSRNPPFRRRDKCVLALPCSTITTFADMSSLTLSGEDKVKFTPVIDAILRSSDLSTISVKKVRTGLSERTGIDFTPFKKSIDTVITNRFDILLAERDAAKEAAEAEAAAAEAAACGARAEAEDQQEEEEDEVADVKPSVKAEVKDEAYSSPDPAYSNAGSVSPFTDKKRKSSSVDEDARLAAELHAQLNGGRPLRGAAKSKPTKKTATKKRAKKKSKDTVDSDMSGGEDGDAPVKKKRKANPNNAFMKPLILSEPLAAFIGESQVLHHLSSIGVSSWLTDSQMARPEVVKRIWAYVKLHGLQDPQDRRYILCDDNMKPVFGDKVHMFTMNKVLATNMYKAEDVASSQPANPDAAASS
ncbi:SWIB-domain-containing protein [Wilcoxina mikolae CBS 423.85]|nr:SWIB-domain-containing protein [Wilcoxina mikolae CBS 423.85]